MSKFRKKPVVIEAFQMTEARGLDNSEWPDWLSEAWNMNMEDVGSLWIDKIGSPHKRRFAITTLEGPLQVSWGDWIIKGIKGELYPCKPDIFEQTYEPVVPPVDK